MLSLRTYNGSQLTAEDDSRGHALATSTAGVGPSQLFTVLVTGLTDGRTLPTGASIRLQTRHGRFVSAAGGGGGALSAAVEIPGPAETFIIEKITGTGPIADGDRVTLRASDGRHFIMARDGGGADVTAESTNRREWETFTVTHWHATPVALRTFDGHFVTVARRGTEPVAATATSAAGFATFQLINPGRAGGWNHGDPVLLQTADGRFLTATNGGGAGLGTTRAPAGADETFTLIKADGSPIRLGDAVSFRTRTGANFLMAVNGGGAVVNAASRQARQWETFQLVPARRTLEEVLAAARTSLGAPVGAPVALPAARGRFQVCAQGLVIEHPDRGAFELHGEIHSRFLALSTIRPGQNRFLEEQLRLLGYPVSDTLVTEDRPGDFSLFERGIIVFRPGPEVLAVLTGSAFDAWLRSSTLGYPRLDAAPMSDARGRYHVCDGGVIYWAPGTGAHAVTGTILGRWLEGHRRLDYDPERTGPDYPDPLYAPPPTYETVSPVLGFPTSDESRQPDGWNRQTFEFGDLSWRDTAAPALTFFAQNMALLPPPAAYNGTERATAIAALISHLRSARPDVVGLSECFVDGERDRIAGSVRDLYPARLDGPDESDPESDGGLLLLSRLPILQSHQTIYRQAVGWDRVANKGVLHARLAVPGIPEGYDVFLTHTQNPDTVDALGGGHGLRILRLQWVHLSSFLRAHSHPGRPALLFGDLNTNALNRAIYDDFRRALAFPVDYWLPRTDGDPGITLDSVRSFEPSRPRLRLDDPSRFRRGERVDLILGWPGLRYFPLPSGSRVLHLQSSVDAHGLGRDLSDHYGIEARFSGVREVRTEVRRPITRVVVEFAGFHCLQTTSGPGADDPYFWFSLAPAARVGPKVRVPANNSRNFGDVDTGDTRTLSGITLGVDDPGDRLAIVVEGWEYDSVGDNDSLGTARLELTRAELLALHGVTAVRSLPLLTGDGGLYAVTVRITVR